MNVKKEQQGVEKLGTGIPGFDLISAGGLPKGRTTLLSGTAGSAKTIFAAQFLAEGITQADENGVFVTFEESPNDIRRNMWGFNWDIQDWETKRKWAFVDVSPEPEDRPLIAGSYDFGALLARIEYAINKVGAKRISIDSIGAIFSQFSDEGTVRAELFRIASALRKMGITAVVTAERTQEYGEIARYGVEEFVADNVIIMRNVLDQEKRRRTLEILKYRGTSHQKGEYPFTVIPGKGVVAIPLSGIELAQKSSSIRISSGNEELDRMCGGGFFRDSVILVSGATGAGKTLMTAEFIQGGATSGEQCLLLAFEESRDQLLRNAGGWSIDFDGMEKDGKLKIVCQYPETMSLEDHLIRTKELVDEFKPKRLAVDSLSALERVSTIKSFREFILALTAYVKDKEIASFFTSTTPTLMGGTSITEAHISTITDSIILLRYVEMYGEMHRGITVLKMRGSMHDKDIREFTIDGQGLHIGSALHNVNGILTGTPTFAVPAEVERIGALFGGEELLQRKNEQIV